MKRLAVNCDMNLSLGCWRMYLDVQQPVVGFEWLLPNHVWILLLRTANNGTSSSVDCFMRMALKKRKRKYPIMIVYPWECGAEVSAL